jgi:DNA-binding response OmpR family regulator
LHPRRRLDPGVTLLDKPFTERELLDKVNAVLASHATAHKV